MANKTNDHIENTNIPFIDVENLFLDPENPRMAKSEEKKDDIGLLKELYRRYDLRDVLISLAHHGYFSEEPLIVVPKDSKDPFKAKIFIVVEGNRRLAALKLLLFEEMRKAVGAKKLPEIKNGILEKLNPVPVKIYASRDEIVPYLGIRHITGIKPWDSQAKAKYIYKLIQSGLSISEVTDIISSRSDVVSRSLFTLYVLNQANSVADMPWEEEAKGFKFSFLYTALGYKSARINLGLDDTVLKDPKPNPVPKEKYNELINFMNDLYGSPDEKKEPKISESREISKLVAVYENLEALEALRSGVRLDVAFRRSEGEKAQLIELTREASFKLDEANSIAPHHKETPEALKWAKRCAETAEQLVNTLES